MRDREAWSHQRQHAILADRFGDGNADADVVFVGEAPGKNEDEQGLPFVGAAGRFLNEMLDLLRIPSVSAKSEHKDDMQKCAELVNQRLLEAAPEAARRSPPHLFLTGGGSVVSALLS